ncbi:hypothetical protein KEM54_002692 [Ascosphaera aggregata]|nr:hypothetical protein KEM54_002692 [Ascosphaera aggregata]
MDREALENRIEIYAQKIADPTLDIKTRANFAGEFRDNLDRLCIAATFKFLLRRMMPILKDILQEEPSFSSSSSEQKLRNAALEVIHRFPFNNPEITPYATEMIDFFMGLIRRENEDNAIICMKIIMDLERHQAEATVSKVQPFLDLILELFSSMEQVVKDTFNQDSQTSPSMPSTPGAANTPAQGFPFRSTSPASSVVSDLGVEQAVNEHLPKAMQSFKVIAECPIMLVSIFHIHRSFMSETVEKMLPIIKNILSLQARPQQKEHADAAARGEIYTGVSRNLKNRAAFGEFITAQIKTFSLMVHMIRACPNESNHFLPQLPDVIVRLLKDCPGGKPVSRKELLVGLKNIINLNHHQILLPKIDELLDERTLIGDGLTNHETRRPLAYALLSDLIHHLRESLNRDQIRKTVEVFTNTLHMDYPGTNLTTMSVGLLLNLAPHIRSLPDKAEARFFLIMILDAISDKFAAMNHEFNNAIKISKHNWEKASEPAAEHGKKDENFFADYNKDPPDWDEIDIFSAQPVKTLHVRHRPLDPVKDNKLLFSFLVRKLKGFFFELKKCCPENLNIEPAFLPVNWAEVSHGFNPEEVSVIRKLFREGSRLFRYYGVGKSEPEVTYHSSLDILASLQNMPIEKEEKDLLEGFGTIFHCIDPATFFEVFHTEIPYLHELMLEHPALMHLPQFFLVCEATSSAFAGMMLQYLMGRIGEVGTNDVSKTKVLLRMFKLSFLAVGMFAEQNEHVLHPHITEIVTKCIQLSVTAQQPMNYFILLRCLFRSIGGSRFDVLYKELLPLLEMLLETFNNLLLNARSPQERDFFVELTLTVPARLSHLLPHLSHLMRPIVVAVCGGTDLVSQGLRTLELCVDNLTADYLDPIMAPFMDELMTALWEHLKPHPYNHFISHTSMRILGKLGGRNRKYLTHPPRLTFQGFADDTPSIDIRLIGSSKDKAFPLDLGVDLAIQQLARTPKNPDEVASDTFYKQQAYQLLSSQLKLFIGFDHPPEDLAALVRLVANDLSEGNLPEDFPDILNTSGRQYSFSKLESEEQTLKKLLKACVVATIIPALASKAQPFLDDVCKHFVIVDVARTLTLNRHLKRPFEVTSGDGPLYMDTKVLADAVVECLSSERPELRDAAKKLIRTMHETAGVVFGSTSKAGQISFFSSLGRAFCHACNAEEWFTKAGGTLGIRFLTLELDLAEAWLSDKQAMYVRALMFVVKDTPPDLPANTRNSAEETLMMILRRYTEGITKEDLQGEKRVFSLCAFLVCELSHQSKHVRKVARKTLETIAQAVKCEVWELVLPVKEKVLKPIFNKPLRALPFPTQVGYIEAINYCLTLKHGVVPFGEQLTRLLMESLALVDAEDDMLAARPAEFKTAQQIIAFRVSCLRLLSTAMSFPEFSSSPNNPARLRVLTVFFKFLHARAPEVIEAAKVGMWDYLAHTPKLPRDVLQHGLRPILMSLQDAKRLSIPGLDGLARLLALLNNHFKVEIGSRLLDHTKIIADDRVLQRASFHHLEQSREMKIIIAIFNVFHLLPPAASAYLKDLVDKMMQLERRLRRTTWSPFREPIVKFLNRYAEESWVFFRSRLNDENYGRLFGQILLHSESALLRSKVVNDSATFVSVGFPTEETEDKHTNMINAIYAVHSICSFTATRGWLAAHPALKQALVNAGCELQSKYRSDKLKGTEQLRALQAQEQLMAIFTTHLQLNTTDLDFLFDIINRVSTKQLRSSLLLSKFVYNSIIAINNVQLQRTLIRRCLDIYNQSQYPLCMQTWVLKFLVNPIILKDVQKSWGRESELLNLDMVEMFNDRVWKLPHTEGMDETNQLDLANTRMEMLQFTATLLKYHHKLIQDFRRDIIKFSWSYIRMEDIINKFAGYVLVSYFIVFYDTPHRLVLQIFISLLRSHNNESMSLVLQALDILGPCLPKRAHSHNIPIQLWARWPRRVLAEENANSNQVMCIFQFLVKHPDLFYPNREDFATLIISYLPKIAGPSPTLSDTKRLALNLVGLIWSWEKRRSAEIVMQADSPNSKKRSADEAGLDSEQAVEGRAPSDQIAPKDIHEYQVPEEFRVALIKYLMNFICSLTERYPVPSSKYSLAARSSPRPPAGTMIIEQAVQLLRNFLSLPQWSGLDIQLYPKMMDPILTSEKADKPDERLVTSMVNCLQVVRVILATRPNAWVLNHLQSIKTLLDKALHLENPEIQGCLHGIEDGLEISPKHPPPIQRILDVLPARKREGEDADTDQSTPEMIRYMNSVASEGLSNGHHISALNILWTLSRCRPEEIDQHIGAILKVFSHKLAKDHVAAFLPRPPPGMPPRSPEVPAVGEPEYEEGIDLISKTIDLVSVRMSHLGEQRRPFLSIIGQVVDRSHDQRLCLKILGITEDWILNSKESWPTTKEKTAVLLKMLSFEHRPDPVPLKRFLDLIIRIYEDPKFTRTDLAVRLEQAFLIGTRTKDVKLRNRFMSLFDKSLSRSPNARLSYVLTSQNWETLKESFWITQASHLLLRAVDMAAPARIDAEDYTVFPTSFLYGSFNKDPRKADVMIDSNLETLIADHRRFNHELGEVKSRDILEPLIQLQYLDTKVAYSMWMTMFAISWSVLSHEERFELEKGIVTLITRPYHQAQLDDRPNVIQALIEACIRARPRCKLPPHVMKFLAKTFDVWHPTAIHLEASAISPIIDTPKARESNLDALVELYAGLQEDDLFYGTWRRRCKFVETNAALSHEQNGMWDKAQQLYESAQVKARTGSVPFSQAEYYLWEDHWIICAEKLQQWDILTDFAKHENFNDLLLESMWRNIELWTTETSRDSLESLIKSVSDAPTPRRLYFQAFLALLKCHANKESTHELNLISDDAVQLSIRKWHQLPKRITNAHIPILENFQLLVELHDATIICNSLAQTNERNLDSKSAELKLLLGTWRDRLPNVWDDINAWQDLVTWRQHIFQLVNSTYLSLLPSSAGNVASNSYAYRGYHEIAWIVNRFAHVARKHQMPEVCINQLSRIYTLPNIEIQEAFLKLREQAKCHYQNQKELTTGLDVINNTNLSYFSAPQKAEFYTLKGMFLSKLNRTTETDDAFGVALYFDIRSARAWAEWAQFNDQCFKADPSNMELARNAMSCYLEAAGLYKSHKSRKILSRILWLLTLDDKEGTISKIFENFGGETPVWYWITFIPQLLTGLTQKEAKLCKAVLGRIAKVFPQSLFFSLRTSREEFMTAKKQYDQKLERASRLKQQSATASPAISEQKSNPESTASITGRSDTKTNDGTNTPSVAPTPAASDVSGTQNGTATVGGGNSTPSNTNVQMPTAASHQHPVDPSRNKSPQPQRPWELCEEVMAGLKTAFPLLALSMETMVDQIHSRFKCTIDEDAYRLIVALLNDGIALINRAPASYIQEGKLPGGTEANVNRFMETVLPAHIRKAFEQDFRVKTLTMYDYIHKLRRWRDRFEEKLDSRASPQSLEAYSSNLAEFKFFKFDEVEVPGQYVQLKDSNKDFIRIDHYLPDVDLVRGPGGCHRRIKIRGHDGSLHPFAVQHPSPRHCRREERMLQLFRIFNSVLAKKKESRRRNINFYLPVIVPLASHIRLIQDDPSYVSLQAIYEDHCRRVGMNKDDPLLFTMEKMRALVEARQNVSYRVSSPHYIGGQPTDASKWTAQQSNILRTEIFSAIQEKWVPHTLVLDYFQRIYPSYADHYLFRRQVSYQYACVAFMTYIMHMNNRMPSKIFFSRGTGNIWASDILPSMHPAKAVFFNPEPVPFRLTPNLQTLMGPLFMEGIFSSTMMALARCLTEPRHELEQQLSIFVRDEMLFWVATHFRGNLAEHQLREFVQTNTDFIVNRAVSLASSPDGSLPANQSVIDLISRAVNPHQLALCDGLWMAYL